MLENDEDRIERLIAPLQRQRNQAMDGVALLEAELLAARGEVARLGQELADARSQIETILASEVSVSDDIDEASE